MLKKFVLASVVALMAMGTAQAGPIVGAQSLDGKTADVVGGNVNTVVLGTVFTIQTFSFTPALDFGDYKTYNGLTFGPTALSFTYLGLGSSILVLDGGNWGKFTGKLIADNNSTTGFRGFQFTGDYTPGTGYPAGLTMNTADFKVTFTQSGPAVSGGAALSSPAVPEPTTYMAALMGVGALMAMARRARKTA